MTERHAALFRKLARACFEGNDIDPGDLQRWLCDAGVLTTVSIDKPCGNDCVCAEVLHSSEFPTDCFRLAPEYQESHAPAGS